MCAIKAAVAHQPRWVGGTTGWRTAARASFRVQRWTGWLTCLRNWRSNQSRFIHVWHLLKRKCCWHCVICILWSNIEASKTTLICCRPSAFSSRKTTEQKNIKGQNQIPAVTTRLEWESHCYDLQDLGLIWAFSWAKYFSLKKYWSKFLLLKFWAGWCRGQRSLPLEFAHNSLWPDCWGF